MRIQLRELCDSAAWAKIDSILTKDADNSLYPPTKPLDKTDTDEPRRDERRG